MVKATYPIAVFFELDKLTEGGNKYEAVSLKGTILRNLMRLLATFT